MTVWLLRLVISTAKYRDIRDIPQFGGVIFGIMESRMETTIIGYIGIVGYILGMCWDNGKWKLPSVVFEFSVSR